MNVSPGTIYHQIKKLEKDRVIEPLEDFTGKERKIYRLTDEGLYSSKAILHYI